MSYLSVSAIGHGKPITEVLHRAHFGGTQEIEIAIGARPVRDFWSALDNFGFWERARFHHTVPIGVNQSYRPDSDEQYEKIIDELSINGWPGIRYSLHPPKAVQSLTDWAKHKIDYAGERDIHVAFENMYPSNNLFYSSATILNFLTVLDCNGYGIDHLVFDISHAHIAGWEPKDFALFPEGCITELHYSCNNGEQDQHKPFNAPSPENDLWREIPPWLFAPGHAIVDEGRRP